MSTSCKVSANDGRGPSRPPVSRWTPTCTEPICTGPVGSKRAAPVAVSAPNTASARICGMALIVPVPVSSRKRSRPPPTLTPTRVPYDTSAHGTSTGCPPAPVSTRSPSTIATSPTSNDTASRSASGWPPTSRASSPIHASRASLSCKTCSAQCTSASAPCVAMSASGNGGSPSTSRRPSTPSRPAMCRNASSFRSSDAACARTSPTTNSRTSVPISLRLSIARRCVDGVAAPGTCRSISSRSNSRLSSDDVGMAMPTVAPRRYASRGMGGASVNVASISIPIRPPACPINNHLGSMPLSARPSVAPSGRWISGTCTRVVTNGAVEPVECSIATPSRTAPPTTSTTAYTVIVGDTFWNSGTHFCVPSVCAAGGPSTSSTKVSNAFRCPGSVSTSLRPCGFASPPTGAPNHAELAPVSVVRPIAWARLPNAPRSSAVSMPLTRQSAQIVARHRLHDEQALLGGDGRGDQGLSRAVVARFRAQPSRQLEECFPTQRDDRVGPTFGDHGWRIDAFECGHQQSARVGAATAPERNRHTPPRRRQLVATDQHADHDQSRRTLHLDRTCVDPQLVVTLGPDEDEVGLRRHVDDEADQTLEDAIRVGLGDAMDGVGHRSVTEHDAALDRHEPTPEVLRKVEHASV